MSYRVLLPRPPRASTLGPSSLVFLAAGVFAVLIWQTPHACADSGRRPNVVVILADDLGYADVGFNGCKDIPTPHIDSLAKHGVRFSNGYVSHPFCSPTRAGLLTGRYQQRFGHETNPVWEPENEKVGLPLDQTTIAQVLGKAGYATGALGKWHLGAAPCFHPNQRGFAEYFGFLGGGHNYLPDLKGSPEYTVPLLRNQEAGPLTDYMTDVLSREAAAFIARHKSQPFFLYLAYNAVHGPLQASEKYLSRFPNIADQRRRTYAAMNSAMDDGVGLVVKALREAGVERDTMVWFFSDNGGPSPDRSPASNEPLRGYKGSLFEGGMRVPFVIQWPARFPAGKVFDQPVISLDVFATTAAAAGVTATEAWKLDGVDIVPHVLGEKKTPPHEVLHWRTSGGSSWAVRQGRYKLVKQANPPTKGDAASPLLFDLDNDLSETKDLAAEKPEIVARLRKLHEDWNSQLMRPRWEGAQTAVKRKAKKAPAK